MSNSRGGLSKREYAAKQAGKPMPYDVKSTTKTSSSKTSGSSSSVIDPNSFGSFKFDPNKYLPGIQQEAASIYDPKVAQLNAVRELNTTQQQQDEIVNREQLATRLTSEIEAINRRGAFFSGGALNKETSIRTEFDRNLASTKNMYQQKDLSILGDIGTLKTQEAQYVRDLLTNVQGSSYNSWKDARDFAYQIASGNRSASMTAEQNSFDNKMKLASLAKSGGGGSSDDKEFNKDLESLRVDVLFGRIDREQAAQTLKNKYGSSYPGVGDAIYLALPDGYKVKSNDSTLTP